MAKIKLCILFVLYITMRSYSADVDTISTDIIFKHVERKIDISLQLVKITAHITLENRGPVPVKHVLIAVEPALQSNLAFVTADDTIIQTSVKGYDEKANFWRVELEKPLNSTTTTVIHLALIFTKLLQPCPSAITQEEDQIVKYNGNLYMYSAYQVESQKTVVFLGTDTAESFTKEKPFAQLNESLMYGPYPNIAPFTEKKLSVHYKNNSPFLTARLERVIEVSHWGNIAIEEFIEIKHTGAKLKGPFSRSVHEKDLHSGPACVHHYRTFLPASASNIYYRDTIGDIETARMRVKTDLVELLLTHRYPLFGGWKTYYILGYNVPSYEYLFHSGDEYFLKIRFIDHIFYTMHVDEVTTKIILPQGSTNIKIFMPYPVERLPVSLDYTYLDIIGRQVFAFRKTNVVEGHIKDFQLLYRSSRVWMLQKPLLVVGFLYALFLCFIIYRRLDFSIHIEAEPHPHSE